MASLLDGINVIDTGEKLMLSSADLVQLSEVLRHLRSEGASNVTEPSQVGQKWIAFCDNPEIAKCSVEVYGFMITISGPTPEAVREKAGEYQERGALITQGPVQENQVWKIYLEDVVGEGNRPTK